LHARGVMHDLLQRPSRLIGCAGPPNSRMQGVVMRE